MSALRESRALNRLLAVAGLPLGAARETRSRFRWARSELGPIARYVRRGDFARNVVMGATFAAWERGAKEPGLRDLVPSLAGELRWLARAVACALTDHAIADGGSSFGPESGHEVLECRRCGRTLLDVWHY